MHHALLFQHPDDAKHKVRVAVGNGLRMDIWDLFQKRFKVPNVCEFFGATEGTTAFINVSNKSGACGRWSPFLVRFIYIYVATVAGVRKNWSGKSTRCTVEFRNFHATFILRFFLFQINTKFLNL